MLHTTHLKGLVFKGVIMTEENETAMQSQKVKRMHSTPWNRRGSWKANRYLANADQRPATPLFKKILQILSSEPSESDIGETPLALEMLSFERCGLTDHTLADLIKALLKHRSGGGRGRCQHPPRAATGPQPFQRCRL